MKNILLVFFILFNLTLSAQSDYQISNQLDFFRSNKIAKGEIKRTLTEADIEGSPYFNDDLLMAMFIQLLKQCLLKYLCD